MTTQITADELARMAARMAASDAAADALKTLRRTHEATGRTAAHQRDVLHRIHAAMPTGPDKAVFELLLEDVERVVAAKVAYDRAYEASVAVRS